MGSRYMCGTLDIGDTRFDDVPFIPSQDCSHWESCQEEAYRKGREDQGELNTDTVREIRELVYQQGIEKGRADGAREFAKWLSNTEYVANHDSFILPLKGYFSIDEVVEEWERSRND